MFKKSVFIFLCLISMNVFSQNKNRKQHIIKLLPNKDKPVKQTDFFVSAVIDNRIYRDNIGIAQKGMFNKKVISKFNKPFEDEILEYLKSAFPESDSKQDVIIRINQLLISENTGAFKETGKAIINLDVLKKTGYDYYLLGSYSAYKEKNSADVTKKHDDRIRAALVDCLLEYQFKLKYESELIEPMLISVNTPKKPRMLTEDINNGFFKTFNELYNNISFVNKSIKFKKKKNHPNKLFFEDISHKKALYFAYYDGSSIFLNASSYSGEKHFVRSEVIDRFLLFNDAFVHQDEAVVSSMAFGVLGILATNYRSHVLLDLYTGQFHVLKESKIKELLKNFPALDIAYKNNKNNPSTMKSILEYLFEKEGKENIRKKLKS